MDWNEWAKDVGGAIGERAASIVAGIVLIWWHDDLRHLADSASTFVLTVCFLCGIAWFFIGMIWAIIGKPLAYAWEKMMGKA